MNKEKLCESKTCKHCKASFQRQPHAHNQQFCSTDCRGKSYYANYQKTWHANRRGAPGPGKIQCAICAKWYVQICTHVFQAHNMTARQYKILTGKDVKRGIIPKHYRQKKAQQNWNTRAIVWENLKKGAPHQFRKGSTVAGRYQRSPQTLERLKNLHKMRRK